MMFAVKGQNSWRVEVRMVTKPRAGEELTFLIDHRQDQPYETYCMHNDAELDRDSQLK